MNLSQGNFNFDLYFQIDEILDFPEIFGTVFSFLL